MKGPVCMQKHAGPYGRSVLSTGEGPFSKERINQIKSIKSVDYSEVACLKKNSLSGVKGPVCSGGGQSEVEVPTRSRGSGTMS